MRKVLSLVVAAVALMLGAGHAQADVLSVDNKRLVRVVGEIDGGILRSASQVLSLADDNKEPIYVMLNSFGGSIYPGLQFVQAIEIAKSRGIVIKCFVTNTAMSMAFYILTYCSERYAFENSLLLWHPAKAGLMGSFDQQTLRAISKDLARLENPMIENMLTRTGIARKTFMYHYKNETVWVSPALNVLAPGFLTVVTDVPGVDNLFFQ